jgi:hypothetical protein
MSRRPIKPREAGARIGIDRLLGDVRTGRFERTLAALTAAVTTAEIYPTGSATTTTRSGGT